MSRPVRFSMSIGGLDTASVIEKGLRAEALGFDFIWMADHLSDILPATAVFDAWTMLAHLGARTTVAKLASGVTDVQRIHPAKMANIVATLDNLTQGRAVLGIGAGEVMNTQPYGMEWEAAPVRISRLREYIEVVRTLWSSSFEKPVSYQGDYYALHDAHLGLRPYGDGRPPIYIGAFASNALLKLTGELADGWYPGAFYSPSAFSEKVKVIQDAAVGKGRGRDDLDLLVSLPVVFSDDAATMGRVKKAFRRELVKNRYMLKILGADEAYEYVSKSLQYQLIAPTPDYMRLLDKTTDSLPISDELLEKGIGEMTAVGPKDRCVESISRFVKAGATRIQMSAFLGDQETYEKFATEVMPVMKAG